jgi:hypothetical protein
MARKRTTIAVIDALGGNAAVAEMLGITVTAVANYRAFGYFPAATYFVLRDALKARGVQADESLWNMKQKVA